MILPGVNSGSRPAAKPTHDQKAHQRRRDAYPESQLAAMHAWLSDRRIVPQRKQIERDHRHRRQLAPAEWNLRRERLSATPPSAASSGCSLLNSRLHYLVGSAAGTRRPRILPAWLARHTCDHDHQNCSSFQNVSQPSLPFSLRRCCAALIMPNLARLYDFRTKAPIQWDRASFNQEFGKANACSDSYRVFRRRTPGPPPFSNMNSIPASSRARRTAASLAAVICNGPSVSSARRTVATPTDALLARSSAVQRMRARPARICAAVSLSDF